MPQFERVVIIGVGLLGGSIGLALQKRGLAKRVWGVGRHLPSLRQAAELGAITDPSESLETACHGADLVVVCTPVQHISQWVSHCLTLSLHSDCIVTDVGSTKASILRALPEDSHRRFCGSHPIAGSERSGVHHATAHLFEGRSCIVTPVQATPPELTCRIEQFWQWLGCTTIQVTPDEHDSAMAKISHLPHLVAAALASTTPIGLLPWTGSGWQDTTRVAAGNVEMWRQIVMENRQPILESLCGFASHLQDWILAIESGDSNRLVALLQQGKDHRDSVG